MELYSYMIHHSAITNRLWIVSQNITGNLAMAATRVMWKIRFIFTALLELIPFFNGLKPVATKFNRAYGFYLNSENLCVNRSLQKDDFRKNQ